MMARSSRPPTLNFLDPFQRSRLLKSSRKIGDILGATPHVLEPCTVHPDHHHHGQQHDGKYRKSKRHVQHPTRLQLSPLSDGDVIEKNEKPEPLMKYPAQHSSSSSNLPSPLPLTVCIPPHSSLRTAEQDTTSSSATSPDRVHRKRMAKLTRVLGENIPPELIRCPKPSHSNRQPRRSSSSSNSPPNRRLSVSCPPPTNLVTRSSPSPSPPNPIFMRGHGSESLLARRADRDFRSTLSSMDGSSITYPLIPPDEQGDVGEWRGEWNVPDAKKRAVVLRNLKKSR